MSRNHPTWEEMSTYLDNLASAKARRSLEVHIATCAFCANRLTEAQRLARELGPTLKSGHGQPIPPPGLRNRVRGELLKERNGPFDSFSFVPMRLGRLLNAAGTLAIIALLAFGVWAIVKSQQTPDIPLASATSPASEINPIATDTARPSPQLPAAAIPFLNTPAPKSFENAEISLTPTGTPALQIISPTSRATHTPTASPLPIEEQPEILPALTPSPEGLIAFSFFNPAPQRQVYEIHLIRPDGNDHRIFPLDGVSEPALSQAGSQLAYRAWGEQIAHRSLLSSSLDGEGVSEVSNFWEDAQPDWSPSEDRLIYASQRETDRRWRLYTSRGDGRDEIALPLAGKAPSFARDGKRFVYVGCDPGGNRCGLWQANLDDVASSAKPILEDPAASAPDWSPTADQIAYMANSDGNWELYLVKADGAGPRRLTADPAIDGLPTWSPDGEWLAFLSNRGENWGIWRLHVVRGELIQVFAFDGGVFTPPHRAPYGERNWWDEQLSWGLCQSCGSR